MILKGKYENYKEGLNKLKIETLEKRREILCLRFANNSLKNSKVSNFFPKKEKLHKMKKRKEKKYVINKANTKRYRRSAIPHMQNLLNQEHDRKQSVLKSFS